MRRRPTRAHRLVTMIVLPAATVLLVSCGSGSSSAQQTPSPPTTIAPASTSDTTVASSTTTAASADSTAGSASTTPASAGAISAEDAQAVRDLATAFWEAYNAYDPDKAVSYLDETYRTAKEKSIRDEIGRIESFGVTLGMSEKSAPVLIGPDQAEIYLNMKEPIGTRTILMKFAKHSDTWTITYSEEAK